MNRTPSSAESARIPVAVVRMVSRTCKIEKPNTAASVNMPASTNAATVETATTAPPSAGIAITATSRAEA